MLSYIVIGIVQYTIIIIVMYYSYSLENIFGDIIFWITFVLSTFLLSRIIEFIKDFFTDICGAIKMRDKETKEYYDNLYKDTKINIFDEF